jgi:hypothetical protein
MKGAPSDRKWGVVAKKEKMEATGR